MLDKIDGIEEELRKYAGSRPNARVDIVRARDVHRDGDGVVSECFKWEITIEHDAVRV